MILNDKEIEETIAKAKEDCWTHKPHPRFEVEKALLEAQLAKLTIDDGELREKIAAIIETCLIDKMWAEPAPGVEYGGEHHVGYAIESLNKTVAQIIPLMNARVHAERERIWDTVEKYLGEHYPSILVSGSWQTLKDEIGKTCRKV